MGFFLTYVLAVIKGALVGIANIIPGVSGGTFALVLGIYERLLESIGAFGLKTAKAFLGLVIGPTNKANRQAFVDEVRRTDAVWIGILAVGAGVAILASSRLIAYLLDAHLAPTLAFFVGLIIPSILVPYRLLERRSWPEVLSCVVGTGGLVALTLIQPAGTGEGLGYFGLFLSGAIAISAMILPGVSGSFMLMILGEYKNVLEAINNLDLARLGVFALGCLVGIAAFVRLLNFLLRRFHSVTMAFLIGLIFGSLWVLWPFKLIPEGAKIVSGANIWPLEFTAEVGWSLGAVVVGLVCSAGVMMLGKLQDPKSHGGEAG